MFVIGFYSPSDNLPSYSPDLQQQRHRHWGSRSPSILTKAARWRRRTFHQRQLPRSVVHPLRQRLQRRLDRRRWEGSGRGEEQEEQQWRPRGGSEGRPQVSHLLREGPPLRCGHHGNLNICICLHWAFPPRWIDVCKWAFQSYFCQGWVFYLKCDFGNQQPCLEETHTHTHTPTTRTNEQTWEGQD